MQAPLSTRESRLMIVATIFIGIGLFGVQFGKSIAEAMSAAVWIYPAVLLVSIALIVGNFLFVFAIVRRRRTARHGDEV
ncbi:MAG: hypothetical protein KGM99_15195 [Burkholderiales bacterium]|nr:hypothetical protein [Burkholderiales bacterium]